MQEPVVNAKGMTDSQIYDWMEKKVSAAIQRKNLMDHREWLKEEMAITEAKIEEASAQAQVEFVREVVMENAFVFSGTITVSDADLSRATGETENTHNQQSENSIGKIPAQQSIEPDYLIISSEILAILESEISARGIKPTPGNLRWVMEIIEKSLPANGFEFLV